MRAFWTSTVPDKWKSCQVYHRAGGSSIPPVTVSVKTPLLLNEITEMNSTYSYSLQTTVRTCNVKTLNWIELKVLWYHPDTPWHIILNPDTSWHVPTHKSWHMWLFFKLFTYRYCIVIIGSLLCVQPHYLISATTFAWSYVLGFRFHRDSRGPYSTVHVMCIASWVLD